MTDNGTQTLQTAILTSLVKSAPNKPGRTALMKFAYLLQTIRGVPLGYRFRLYNMALMTILFLQTLDVPRTPAC